MRASHRKFLNAKGRKMAMEATKRPPFGNDRKVVHMVDNSRDDSTPMHTM
jgi:hypothetical protein